MQKLRPSARRLRGVIGAHEVRESGSYMVRIPVYAEPGLPRRHCVAWAFRWHLPDTLLAAACLRGVVTRVGTGSGLLSVPTRVTNLPNLFLAAVPCRHGAPRERQAGFREGAELRCGGRSQDVLWGSRVQLKRVQEHLPSRSAFVLVQEGPRLEAGFAGGPRRLGRGQWGRGRHGWRGTSRAATNHPPATPQLCHVDAPLRNAI